MSVVLGYDETPGARQALSVALAVAARYAEPLILVYGTQPPGGVGEEASTVEAALLETGQAVVRHAVATAREHGVETTVELVSARPVEALLEVADRYDASVIVVGTWGESPLRGAILGSTPHKLLHLSRRPVLCVPAPD